jgi:adenylosuccinate synthase
MIKAIIGANFGDEGKGLAVNHFSQEGKNLVIRHNGGAQSGHTVEIGDKKFVFHELSSGSFNGADTYWADTYHPDLYTLGKEYGDFQKLTGIAPVIFCDKNTKITLIDDVFLNCFKETQDKAGSCGMGIWECVYRNNAGFGVTIEQVQKLSIEQLFFLLKDIRQKYSIPKLLKYAQKYRNSDSMYKDMLLDSATIFNYVVEIKNNVEKVRIVDLGELFDKYDNIIFENGQGLLIDGDFDMVHGTPSKTGLYNVNACLKKYGKTLDEAIYVTRPYLTRHGRGNFVEDTFYGPIDETNVHNQWQESIRYGRFDSVDDLVKRIKADCPNLEPHILVTHTNYTDGLIMTKTGDVAIKRLPFEKIYTSDNKTTVQE